MTFVVVLDSLCASKPVNSIHMALVELSTIVVASVVCVTPVDGRFHRATSMPFKYTTPPSLARSHRDMASQAQSRGLGTAPVYENSARKYHARPPLAVSAVTSLAPLPKPSWPRPIGQLFASKL
jgi:hypothetical protein